MNSRPARRELSLLAPPAKRRSWLAGWMSGLFPGLGHLYLGRVRTAMALGFLPAALLLVTAVGMAAAGTSAWRVALLGLVVTLALLGMLVLHTRQMVLLLNLQPYRLLLWNKVVWYLVFAVAQTVLLIQTALWVRSDIISLFRVPSGSMIPNLLPGDLIGVVRWGPEVRPTQRGDIVVFNRPGARSEEAWVKRVIGLPGDTIEIRKSVVWLNDQPLPQQALLEEEFWHPDERTGEEQPFRATVYQETLEERSYPILLESNLRTGSPRAELINRPTLIVPRRQLYLLGDFRLISNDSRQFGPVELDDVIGRVSCILWSFGPQGLRPDRVGQQP